MENELRLQLDGTTFRFFIKNKGNDDGGCNWTDANISVTNPYFNYQTSAEFLTYTEIKEIYNQLANLLNDDVRERLTLEFIEPDLQITLNPRRDLRNEPKCTYVREGFEIQDISAEFIFYLSPNGNYTDQRYTLPLYRSEIESLVELLRQKIKLFDGK